jgi:hypothetical protein
MDRWIDRDGWMDIDRDKWIDRQTEDRQIKHTDRKVERDRLTDRYTRI